MSSRQSQAQTPDRSEWLAEDQLWGKPQRGDGEFLVALRARLDQPKTGLWLGMPKLAAAGAFAVVLVVALWLPGNFIPNMPVASDSVDLNSTVDQLASTDISPDDVADYLGVLEQVETTPLETDYTVDGPSTDDLMTLDDADFEVVLAALEETNFF